MAYTGKPDKKEEKQKAATENKAGILQHRKAAKHLEKAADLHEAAAKAQEKGRHKRAAKINVKAIDHYTRAAKHHQSHTADGKLVM